MKKLSFIIPSKDDPFLERLLHSLHRQTRKDFEVIIMDSSANSPCLNGLELDIKIIHLDCGVGSKRNLGAKLAKSDLLVFVDADMVLPPTFVDEVVKLFEKNENLVAAGFPIYPTKTNKIINIVYRVLRFLNKFSYRYKKPRIPTGCAVYRKWIFNHKKFLDLVGEDVLFSSDILKYGEAIYFEKVKVYEEPRRWDRGIKLLTGMLHYLPSYLLVFLITLPWVHGYGD